MLTFNNLEEMKPHYIKGTNTYVFKDDITIKFDFCADASINAMNINAYDISANNIDALDIKYWAVCIAYHSFKCKSVKGRRENSIHKCLDQEIEFVKDQKGEINMKTNNTEVKGLRTIDVCNNRAENLQIIYHGLETREAQLLAELKAIDREKCSLRIEEVKNVCDYLRACARAGTIDKRDIETYLCHCQNMLNGNIDGIFLKFEEK